MLIRILVLSAVLSGVGLFSTTDQAWAGESLDGCQISRKGTKIRCPHGMFIRQDVVERKIASERSGKPEGKSKPGKSKKKSDRR